MIKIYFKTAWRSLKRDKGYTFINISGLSVGLVVFIAILLFVNREKSYDRWNNDLQHVFRVDVSEEKEGEVQTSQSVQYPLGTFLVQNFPEVEAITRAKIDFGESIITPENQDPFYFNKLISADSNFFSVFPYVFVHGTASALDNPNTAVLTAKAAKRIFGNENPVGKTFKVNLEHTFTVTGVIEKPGPSHLDFEICLSYHSTYFADNWFMKNFDTYVKLRNDAKTDLLADKAAKVYAENYARAYNQFGDNDEPQNKSDIIKRLADDHGIKNPSVFFEPVCDIHLQPKGAADYTANLPIYDFSKSNQLPIKIFSVIALLILLLACINYINMSVAQNIKRARESGIRKVMGAGKTQLILQYITEAFMICLLSLAISIGIAAVLTHWLNNQFQIDLALWNQLYNRQNITLFIQLGAILVITSIVTGIYPAYVLSAYHPVRVLKGEIGSSRRSHWLQNALIILQYGIASAFIICIIVVSAQMNYMRKSDPGFDAAQVLRIEVANTYLFPGQPDDKSVYIKESLMRIPGVSDVSSGESYPGMTVRSSQVAHQKGGGALNVEFSLVNYYYFKVLGIPVMEGRTFSPAYGKDSTAAAVINQAAMNKFGWKNAIGKQFELMDQRYHVIGVVKDSRMEGYEESVAPQVFMMGVGKVGNFAGHRQLFVKINPRNVNQTLASVLAFWKKTEPQFPVKYSWLDEDFNKLLFKYERFGKIILWLTIVSLFIAGMGMFALSNYTARTRTKEIGIRKVLGASVVEMVRLLSAKYVLLALTAFVSAMPVAWLAANKWLQHFAYRIDIKWWMFALACGVALFIALLIAGYHAVRSARANPVESLRSE